MKMKQKQNRNLLIETLNGGKYKKGNLTETVNVLKVTWLNNRNKTETQSYHPVSFLFLFFLEN